MHPKDLNINFKNYKKIKIDTQIHIQKLIILSCILNYIIRNLIFVKKPNLKSKYPKNEITNPDLNLWLFWVHMSDVY